MSATRVGELLRRWRWVLITFLFSRLLLAGVMRLSRMILVHGPLWNMRGFTGILVQGRGEQYLEIARNGYVSINGDAPTIGFFPLYPGLVRLFSFVLGNYEAAALVISHLALLGAGILLHELIDLDQKLTNARRAAITFLMFSPVAFIYSSASAESTFLFLSLAALFAARRGKWLGAALCGMCVAATDTIGVLILAPLIIECQRARAPKQQLAVVCILVPLGSLLFLIFAQLKFGNALLPLQASELWDRGLLLPTDAYRTLANLPEFYRYFAQINFWIGLAGVLAAIFFKLRPSYAIYGVLLLVAFVCSNDLQDIARHLAIVFPLFIAFAELVTRFDWATEAVLGSWFMLSALSTIMVANGHWLR